MSQNHDPHAAHGYTHQHAPKPEGRKWHRDWRIWLMVVIMIGGIIIYLATLDFRK